MDDASNHLLGPDELAEAFDGRRANLAPSGLLVFDVNTLPAYSEIPDIVVEGDERLICWRAASAPSSRSPGKRLRWSSTSSPTRGTGYGGAH